jgi:2'-5' RNA ligase
MSPTLISDIPYRPRSSDPVFLMVRPDQSAASQINRLAWDLRREHKLIGEPLEVERFHSTLLGVCPFGRLTGYTLAAIREALTSIAMSGFLLGYDRAESFRHENNQPLVLRGDDETVIGLVMLYNEVVAALRKIGFARRREVFTPHLTLLYDHHKVRPQPVEEIRWTVREFSLACSLRGRSHHKLLARWKLQESS